MSAARPLPFEPAGSDPMELVLSRLEHVRRGPRGVTARCPAHDDKSPSLSVGVGNDGRVLLKCHAGCAPEAIVTSIGLTLADLFPSDQDTARPTTPVRSKAPGWTSLRSAARAAATRLNGEVARIHEYPTSDRSPHFAVVRLQTGTSKTFRPLRFQSGRWQSGDPAGPLPLFRLPELADTDEVLVVEGEVCAEVAAELGFVATTSSHGAKSAGKTDWAPIANKRVVVWPDADQAGAGYAQDVAAILRELNPDIEIRQIRIPDTAPGHDLVDWRDQLRADGVPDPDIAERLAVLMEGAEPFANGDSGGIAGFASSANGFATGNAWPAPTPIHRESQLPAFPIESAFPPKCEKLREFVEAVAHTYQVPTDLPAFLALAIFGLPLSRTVEVIPRPGWREQLNLYVMVLLESGERKSPVLRTMLDPVNEWQRQISKDIQLDIADAQSEIEELNERLVRTRRHEASGKTSPPGATARDLRRRLLELESQQPKEPSLVATEATTEAINEMLFENEERGMIAAAEADVLDVMLGRYSRGQANMGPWLTGYSGDACVVRRRGRQTVRLNKPALTVALAIQPAAIRDLMASEPAEGRGLLARFFYSRPASLVGYRDLEPDPIPISLTDWYRSRLHKLLSRRVPESPEKLTLDKDAYARFFDMRHRIEVSLQPDQANGSDREWPAKLAGGIARIAGILHCVADPELRSTSIDTETLTAAMAWEPYLVAHQRHVAAEAGLDKTAILAQRILEWIRRNDRVEFSSRDVFEGVKGKLARKTKDLDEPLLLLEELNWIRRAPAAATNPKGGRPPSARFEANPAALHFEREAASQYSQNSQYPKSGPREVSYGQP